MTKHINSKKLLSVLLAIMTVLTIFSFSTVNAQAATYTAFNQVSSSKPMKTYILSTSNIPCYTSSSLKTRGTVTAGKSSTAYIAPSDDVYVVSVDKSFKWVKVTYPVGKKRYTAYIALNKITSNNSSHKKTTAAGKVMTYKRANSSTGSSSMYISKGETVYLVATSGSYYQVFYPCSGGWRLAWVTKTNYNKYLAGSSTTTTTTTKTNSITVTGYVSPNKTGSITVTANSANYLNKVKAFLNTSNWKNGAAWSSSKKPVKSSWNGKGCCAYTADFCYYVYGNGNPNKNAYVTNISNIQTGDILYFSQKPHFLVVLQRNGNQLITAEGNASGKVCVSNCKYTISGNTIYQFGSKYSTTVRVTRYGI